jgi:hypothetical protein
MSPYLAHNNGSGKRAIQPKATQNPLYIGVNADALLHILCFVGSDSCNTVTYFPWQGGPPNVWQKCCSVSVTRRAKARLQMQGGIPWRRGGEEDVGPKMRGG